MTDVSDLTREQLNRPGVETETGTGLYKLPRDHAHHGGLAYAGAEYQESMYFTALGIDKKTGDPYSVFFCPTVNGYTEKYGRPWWTTLFAVMDIKRKVFQQCVHGQPGPITTKGSGPEVPGKDFWYHYLVDGSAIDGSSTSLSYKADGEVWRWTSKVPNPNTTVPNDAYEMDVTGTVAAPGYFTPLATGLTLEGSPTKGHDQHFSNALTGYGLSYYINVANMPLTGRVKCKDIDIDFEGVAWQEHQWGNYRNEDYLQGLYHWGYVRFDDGVIASWRSFYDKTSSKENTELNRWVTIYPDGRIRYFNGSDAFTYEVTRIFTSPSTGIDHPVEGYINTPLGRFFCKTLIDNQEAQTLNKAGLWEGVKYWHKDGPDGPVVGRSFVEHGWAPNPPGGMDLPYRPELRRKLDGGYPVLEDAVKKYLNF